MWFFNIWRDRDLRLTALCLATSLCFGVLIALWLRVLDALAGRTIYVQAAVMLALASGLAGGAGCGRLLVRRVQRSERGLALLLLATAFLLLFQAVALPGIAGGWQRLVVDLTRTFDHYLLTLAKSVGVLALAPALLVGVMSVIARHAIKAPPRAAACLTPLLLLGVLPTLAAFELARGVIVPRVGAEALLRAAALCFGGLAAFAAWRPWLSPLLVAMPVLLLLLQPEPRVSVLTEGVFARLVHRDSGFAQGMPVFARHTRHHTVTAYEDDDYGTVMALDGRPLLFGNRFHAVRTLTAAIPLFLQPTCARAAVCGPQAGLALPFLLRAGVDHLAVAGSDREVVTLALAADSLVAGDESTRGWRDLKRARFHPRSAYHLILLTGEPGWLRGTASMYGGSLLRRCRAALTDGGVAALHLDTRAMSRGGFKAIAERFCSVFPWVQVWQIGPYDWLLTGAREPLDVRLDAMLALLERPAVLRDLARAGLPALPELLACRVCDGIALMQALERVAPVSAWREAWRAPRIAFNRTDTRAMHPAVLSQTAPPASGWLLPGDLDSAVYVTLLDRIEAFHAARRQMWRAFEGPDADAGEIRMQAARAAAEINPRDVLLTHVKELLDLEARRRIAIGDFKGGRQCYERLLSLGSGQARWHFGMGYCLRATGETEPAYRHFARAVAMAPTLPAYRLELAQVALSIGAFDEADQQYEQALKQEPRNPAILFEYAKALAKPGRATRDFTKALRLAEAACTLTQWRNMTYAYGLADLYMDAGRVLEGMGLKRRLKESLPPNTPASESAK